MRIPEPSRVRRLSMAAFATAVAATSASVAAPACTATSGPTVPAVVELYTSQGCDSCPPADRWLTSLAGRADIVTLAFHVDYWDTRDWKDRFSQARFTRRQNATLRTSGARFAYTPEILVDGRDTPDWNRLNPAALPSSRPATLAMTLTQDATDITLAVTPGPGAPTRVSGYLAVVDDGLQTTVDAGENRGATLDQDNVVREWLPWSLDAAQPAPLRFTSRTTPEPGATRHWVAVALDGSSGRPLQAVRLACVR